MTITAPASFATRVPTTLSRQEIDQSAQQTADLVADLERVMAGEVRFDAYSRMLYSTDASLFQVQPLGVVIPKHKEDVQAVMEVAARHRVPVLPRGGGSALAGQTVGPALVIDTSKYLNRVVGINEEAATVTVEAGLVVSQLNRTLAPLGWMLGPDPASADRATVGGSVGNNATGSHSILYGMMADNVVETDVVLADGSIARFGPVDVESLASRGRGSSLEARIYASVPGLVQGATDAILERFPRHWRRASGYNLDRLAAPLLPPAERSRLSFDSRFRPAIADPVRLDRFNLAQLITGSEGSLAVVREVTLRIVPKPKMTGLGVLHFDSLLDACRAITDVLEREPSAAELLDKHLMDLARAQPEWAKKLRFVEGDPEAVLLIELYGEEEEDLAKRLDAISQHVKSRGWTGTFVTLLDPARQADVWSVRKAGLNILMSQRGDYKPVPGIEDVSVPPENLADYMAQILDYCAQTSPMRGVAVYAHASAGCLHVRPLINTKTLPGIQALQAVGEYACDLAVSYGGTMSGEHGDGYARSALNPRLFGPELYETMRQVKRAFDPDGRMNPGKIVDAPPVTANLRFGPDYETIELKTVFDWGPDGGYAPAIEMCNGAGVCRKLNSGSMCPSYMATRDERDTTRGRANALRNALAGRIPHEEIYSEQMYEVMDLCLGCKACKSECPSAVDMAKIKAEYLVHYYRANGLPLFNRLMGLLPTLNKLLYRVARPAVPLVNGVMASPLFKKVQARIGVHPNRSLPKYAAEPFSRWFHRRAAGLDTAGETAPQPTRPTLPIPDPRSPIPNPQSPSSPAGLDTPGKQPPSYPSSSSGRRSTDAPDPRSPIPDPRSPVILFHDTWHEYNYTGPAKAAVKVLEAAGYDVFLAEGRACCGRPLITGGQADKAKAWVDHNVALLAPYATQGIPIVGIEPSCILTLRDEYLNLASDKERAAVLAQHALTFEEFVAQEMEAGRFQGIWAGNGEKALLHGHCHHKAMVGNEVTVAALRGAGYDVSVIPSGCCGMAGDFGYGADHYEISRTIAEDRLLPAIRAAGADVTIVASGVSCRQQISHFAERQPVHIAEALARVVG